MKWIIILIVGYLLYRYIRKLLATPNGPKGKPPREIQDEMVEDPMCKVYLPKRQALVEKGADGKMHYFCSPECRDKFIEQTKKEKAS
jgi:YHS domain-containing protein